MSKKLFDSAVRQLEKAAMTQSWCQLTPEHCDSLLSVLDSKRKRGWRTATEAAYPYTLTVEGDNYTELDALHVLAQKVASNVEWQVADDA